MAPRKGKKFSDGWESGKRGKKDGFKGGSSRFGKKGGAEKDRDRKKGEKYFGKKSVYGNSWKDFEAGDKAKNRKKKEVMTRSGKMKLV